MTRQRAAYGLFAVAFVLAGTALYVIFSLGWLPWLLLAVSGTAAVGLVARAVCERRLGPPPRPVIPPLPTDDEIWEHFCRFCDMPATGVVRVISDRPSSWVFYCNRHVAAAVEALGRKRRRRGAR